MVEDYDYWLRIWRDCGEIRRIPHILYRYRKHDGSLTVTKMKLVRQRHIMLLINYLTKLTPITDSICNIISDLYLTAPKWELDLEPFEGQIFSCVPQLKGMIKKVSPQTDLVIFGAGGMGKATLVEYKAQVIAFADNSRNKQGTNIDGVMIYSLKDVKKLFPNALIMIAMNVKLTYSVIKQLTSEGIEKYVVYEYCRDHNNKGITEKNSSMN